MRTQTTIFAAMAALVLAAGSASAQDRGHDKDKHRDKDKGKTEKHLSREDAEAIRLRDANGDRLRIDNDGHRVPPGLAKKPGGMPPGQYKKHYGTHEGASALGDIFRQRGYTVTRVAPYGQSEYVYYRLRDGAERRALVSNGSDRLRFTNVPATVLQAVLAQLY